MAASLSLDRLAAVRSPSALLVLAGLLGGGMLGALAAYNVSYGLAGVGLALIAVVTIRRPVNLAVLAVCGVFAVQRLGAASTAPGSSGGISYTDALITVAAFLALPAVLGTPEFGRLRLPLLGLGAYLGCLLPSVILHASSRVYLEWGHRLVLVGGSLLVGAWLAREGRTRLALRWLTVVACVIAVLAMRNTAITHFRPATPLGLNKNFIGGMFSSVIVVVAAAPKSIGIGARAQALTLLLLAGGLVASHSRGGMLAAAAGLLLAFILDRRAASRRIRALGVLVAVVLAGFSFFSIRSQLGQNSAQLNNGSIGVRFNVEKVTRQVWRTSPITGVGLKYFTTGKFGPFAQAANNAVDNELAESGVIGLAGFVVLQGAVVTAGVRRRRSGPLISAATGVVVASLLHGMVDIYWSAGSVTLSFLILGMALTSTTANSKYSAESASPVRAYSPPALRR